MNPATGHSYARRVQNGTSVRLARASDAGQLARVHVDGWRQTYRGTVPDAVLDDPELLATRERFWHGALTDERWARNRVAVAESGDTVVGIAMAGPPPDPEAWWRVQLHVLYVDAAHHGSGAAADLLDTVVDPSESAALWVVDPNPRAQAFYRKHGFTPDGNTRTEDGVRELRWVRA